MAVTSDLICGTDTDGVDSAEADAGLICAPQVTSNSRANDLNSAAAAVREK
jgi:glycerate-2-kinase